MPLESDIGAWTPGTTGRATHHGDPLTVDQIKALEPGQRVVVTWSGGNGPHEYEVVHSTVYGVGVATEYTWVGPLLSFGPDQRRPLNRVTLL